jgi:hypothetical protein
MSDGMADDELARADLLARGHAPSGLNQSGTEA